MQVQAEIARVMPCVSPEPNRRKAGLFQGPCSMQCGGSQAENEVSSPQKRGDENGGKSPGALCALVSDGP